MYTIAAHTNLISHLKFQGEQIPKPILYIAYHLEWGRHMYPSVLVDGVGHYLVTSSYDNTAKVSLHTSCSVFASIVSH